MQIVVLSAGSLSVEVESALDAKIAKNFKVRWLLVRYDKDTVVQNPEITETSWESPDPPGLKCQVQIQNPKLVLGIAREAAITEATDSEGREIVVAPLPFDLRPCFERPRYTRQFCPPTPLPKWRAYLRKLLRRPPRNPPTWVDELQPSRINMPLDMGSLAQAGAELRSVRGYFRALVAGSIEYIEVPFQPGDAWVRLTPDLEIQVTEAVCINKSFRCRIDMRPEEAGSRGFLKIGEPVSGRFVVAQQFIGKDGKPIGRSPRGMGLVRSGVMNMTTYRGSVDEVKAIRFAVAVDAREYRIPFEVQHVSLSKP